MAGLSFSRAIWSLASPGAWRFSIRASLSPITCRRLGGRCPALSIAPVLFHLTAGAERACWLAVSSTSTWRTPGPAWRRCIPDGGFARPRPHHHRPRCTVLRFSPGHRWRPADRHNADVDCHSLPVRDRIRHWGKQAQGSTGRGIT